MNIPRDVMSPELQIELRACRRKTLLILRSLRRGSITKDSAAKTLMSMYVLVFSWRMVECEFDTLHPFRILASRILRCARILKGDEWVVYRMGHL